MKKILSAIALLPALAWGANIVPQPASYAEREGSIPVPQTITVGGSAADQAIKHLAMRGIEAAPAQGSAWLTVTANPSLPAEAYTLEVTPRGVAATAADEAGAFYAIETLTQMLDQAQGELACASIADEPRFGYRGMMLDVVRCYLPIDEVKKLVDVASQLKINKLHLHLTDDNGWRMEIKKYPKLTEVGAWRVDRPELFPARRNPKEGEPATYGGFYTQDELRSLVAYAAERQIEVIPEIEMPAHAVAAIASYPELACPVVDRFVGVLPGIGGHDASIIMCAGRDSTLQFVRDVIDEVVEVFPSPYLHLGGDEANKEHWEQCALCNQRLADEGLADYEALQGWFMDQINAYAQSKGRQALGWDEVTYGKPKEPMVIMGWQGDGQVAVDYARETGSRFIMTPAKSTYMIRYQGPQWFEPFTYFGNITLRDVYDFDPVKPDWTPAMADQLWGIQGSMWTEFCRQPSDVQYMLFPRMLALADAAWRPKGESQWPEFIAAADAFLPRLDAAGIAHAESMYNIQHTLRPNGDGTLLLTAECIRPDATIMLCPDVAYDGPMSVSEPETITLQAFTPSGKAGKELQLDINFNKATGRSVDSPNCNNGLLPVLTNGLRGSLRNSDFEWAGWHNREAEFTIDLGQQQPIESVAVGALGNANVCIALPSELEISVYQNPRSEPVAVRKFTLSPDEQYPQEAVVRDFVAGGLGVESARYITVRASNPGRVPDGMPREGAATWLYFDEVAVE